MENLVGQQIGRYRITRHMARGGMADVYLAHDTALDREICLKLMLPRLMQHEEITRRFRREAEAIARLEHPQIVDIYDIGIAPTTQPYIAMAYVPGGTLEELLRRRREQGQPLTAVQALKIMRNVATGLQAVHQSGMVHRDLKPSNILIGRGGTPILADLGIVSVEQATRLTRTGQQLGTPYYMAPEQVRGIGVDARTDLYACGVMLYEMLSGQFPFTGNDPVAVMHQHLTQSPAPLEELKSGLTLTTCLLVHRCLAKDPTDRYQDINALIAALDEAINAEGADGQPQPAPLPPGREPAPSTLVETVATSRSYRWTYLLGAIALVLLVGWFIWGSGGENRGVETAASTADTARTLVGGAAETAVASAAGLPQATSTLAAVLPTNTPNPSTTPTATSTPSPTPSLTPSPLPTRTPLPTATEVSEVSTVPSPCLVSAGERWGSTLYAAFAARLGCPLTGENRTSAAYQRFANGLAVWREDADLVYFLLDNGSYLSYSAGAAPPGYFDSQLLKGAFGYYWNSNETVRESLGQPQEAEAIASQFAVQDFAQGVIFYFLENGANNYVLLDDSRVWIARTE